MFVSNLMGIKCSMYKYLTFMVLIVLGAAACQTRAESIEQFYHDYHTQLCTGIIACSDDVAVAENLQYTRVTNVDACVLAFTKNRDQANQWKGVLDQKTARFEPEASQACLTAVSETSCKTLIRGLTRPAVIKGCEGVIVGTVENKAQCDSNLECKSSAASCVGTCEEPGPLLCGEDLCSSAEYCDHENKACATPKKIGATCSNRFECADSCIKGICQLPRPVVEPGGQCGKGTSKICSIGEYCPDDQCTPFRKKGQTCSLEYDDALLCEAPLDCQEGKCSTPG